MRFMRYIIYISINYVDMENDLSEVFNLSKVDFKNEMKQIYDSSDMNKGILVDFTKLYQEWIIKRKIKKIEKIYIYYLTYENLNLSVKSK